MCFNPRTHAGCDKDGFAADTDRDGFNPRTHAGCDRLEGVHRRLDRGFNPRTHAGCDAIAALHDKASRQVSIHAPTRGATTTGRRSPASGRSFNPRTHAGCDWFIWGNSGNGKTFQSTHPRGVRPDAPARLSAPGSFNPRTHAGCDNNMKSEKANRTVSIHAPTRGATSTLTTLPFTSVFQSTHPRGVRPVPVSRILASLMFQSTHPRGVRPTRDRGKNIKQMFQSTHPRGVRRRMYSRFHRCRCFNPRTHAGCDAPCSTWATRSPSFNPRTHAGCDLSAFLKNPVMLWFQSTHPRGVRPACGTCSAS